MNKNPAQLIITIGKSALGTLTKTTDHMPRPKAPIPRHPVIIAIPVIVALGKAIRDALSDD